VPNLLPLLLRACTHPLLLLLLLSVHWRADLLLQLPAIAVCKAVSMSRQHMPAARLHVYRHRCDSSFRAAPKMPAAQLLLLLAMALGLSCMGFAAQGVGHARAGCCCCCRCCCCWGPIEARAGADARSSNARRPYQLGWMAYGTLLCTLLLALLQCRPMLCACCRCLRGGTCTYCHVL
jgi:hypothetical protein